MKIMCKKDYTSGKEIFFRKNMLYDIVYIYTYTDKQPWYELISENYEPIFIGGEWFYKYFYSIEETKNMIRIKMIDDMLK